MSDRLPTSQPCASCGAPIAWAVTAKTGRAIPLDADPVPGGNVRVVTQDGRLVATVVGLGQHHDGPLYLAHFATCTNPTTHRRKRR